MTTRNVHTDCVWAGILADWYQRHDTIYTTPPGGHHGGRQGAELRLDRGATTGCSQPDRPVFVGPDTPAAVTPPQAARGTAPGLPPISPGATKDVPRVQGKAVVPALGSAGTTAAKNHHTP